MIWRWGERLLATVLMVTLVHEVLLAGAMRVSPSVQSGWRSLGHQSRPMVERTVADVLVPATALMSRMQSVLQRRDLDTSGGDGANGVVLVLTTIAGLLTLFFFAIGGRVFSGRPARLPGRRRLAGAGPSTRGPPVIA